MLTEASAFESSRAHIYFISSSLSESISILLREDFSDFIHKTVFLLKL